jgi:hypothetical protein
MYQSYAFDFLWKSVFPQEKFEINPAKQIIRADCLKEKYIAVVDSINEM